MVGFGVETQQREFRVPALPCLENGEVVQRRQTGVGYVSAGFEVPQLGFSGERPDNAVTQRGTQQIHALQLFAECKVRESFVRDASMMLEVKLADLGQLAKYRKPLVRDVAAG